MSEIEQFRQEKDDFFRTSPHGPLMPEQQSNFNGLNYFEPSDELDLQVEVETFDDPDEIEMQTTTGGVQTYQRFARFKVTVDGASDQLTIYHNQNGYFLPFVDSLAGDQTYPAGRYLEPERLDDGRFHVDFNYAYNPYCAYNDQWSCPITPAENRISVPIRAGEKIFKHD
jgi:hypothetical protein